MGKPSSLREVAELFTPPTRKSEMIMIAGGAAIDLATADDIDIFFCGPFGASWFWAWKSQLETRGDVAVIRQRVDDKSPYVYFPNLILERWQIRVPEFDKFIDAIIIDPNIVSTPARLLETSDLVNIQIGYTLDGTIITTEEFDPNGFIRFSKSGLTRIPLYKANPQKVKNRLKKYQRKLGASVLYQDEAARHIPGLYNDVDTIHSPRRKSA